MESSPSRYASRLVMLALLTAPLLMCAPRKTQPTGDAARLSRTNASGTPFSRVRTDCPCDLREPRLLPSRHAGQPVPVTQEAAQSRTRSDDATDQSLVVPCQVSTDGWVTRGPGQPARTTVPQPPARRSHTAMIRRLPPPTESAVREPAVRIARTEPRVATRVAAPDMDASSSADGDTLVPIRQGAHIVDSPDIEHSRQSPEAATTQQPSPALQAVANRAQQRVSTAFSLAQRGAVYSARTEFIGAVRMISEALDAQSATERRSQALAQAMRALREVEDFAPRGWQAAGEIDLPHVVSGHRTPVLKEADLTSLTPLLASQRYYTFAQEQFASAVEPVPAGSQALYGLGKLQAAMPSSGSDAETLANARAMVYFQAALLVDRRNFMAANELGVLLARMGQWQHAREVLRLGAALGPRPELWRNLARVHQELGEFALAASAHQEAVRSQQQVHRSAWPAHLSNDGGFVRWVSPQQLGQSPGGDTAVTQPAPPVPATRPPSPSGISAWLPWSTTKR